MYKVNPIGLNLSDSVVVIKGKSKFHILPSIFSFETKRGKVGL